MLVFTVGKGNNANLIKDLLKKRWWWNIQDDKNKKSINFSWTQLKDKNYFQNEAKEDRNQEHTREVISNQGI